MFESSIQTLEQFKEVLSQLPKGCYDAPCTALSDASIGKHTRHIIELYTCLIDAYDGGDACYDSRKRDQRIEQEVDYALLQLTRIQQTLLKPNKPLKVRYELNGGEVVLESNYHREVMYNLEHAIHHHALIKVGINHFTQLSLPESFGVAPSTMHHRKLCAQ